MPVSTNVLPASGPSPGGGPSLLEAHALRRAGRRSARASAASASWSWISSAIFGPMPGVSSICSGVAASSASIERKRCGEVAAGDRRRPPRGRSRTARARTACSLGRAGSFVDSSLRATARRSPRAPRAARASGGRSPPRSSRGPAPAACATCFSPRPSMSIAPRETKCLSSCHWRSRADAVRAAGEDRALGLDRRRVAGRAARRAARRRRRGPRARRRAAPGETTCGITSPARRTMTSSPTRMSLRARSSSLCSVASFTVTPPTCTGSSTANGCRSPNLPTFHSMPCSVVTASSAGTSRRSPSAGRGRRRRAGAAARGRRP